MSVSKKKIKKPSFIKSFIYCFVFSLIILSIIYSLLLYVNIRGIYFSVCTYVDSNVKYDVLFYVTQNEMFDKNPGTELKKELMSQLYDDHEADFKVLRNNETFADSSLTAIIDVNFQDKNDYYRSEVGYRSFELDPDCKDLLNTPEIVKYLRKNDNGRLYFSCRSFYIDPDYEYFIPVNMDIYTSDNKADKDYICTISFPQDKTQGLKFIDQTLSSEGEILGNPDFPNYKIACEEIDSREIYDSDKNAEFVSISYGRTQLSISKLIFSEYKKELIIASSIYVLAVVIFSFIPAIVIYSRKRSQYEIYDYRMKTSDAMAHDLRTPLASMKAYAENLENGIGTEKQAYYAGKINDKIDQMNDTIGSILDFSRSENYNIEINKTQFDVVSVLRETVKEYKQLIDQKDIKLHTMPSDRVMLHSDIELFKQAVDNLINNAVKYTGEHGIIDITADEHALCISNTLSEKIEKPERLKEPFAKGNNSRYDSGSGLGLAIADNNLAMLKYGLDIKTENDRFICTVKFD